MWMGGKQFDFMVRLLDEAKAERDRYAAMLRGEMRGLEGRLADMESLTDSAEQRAGHGPQTEVPMPPIVPQTWMDDMERQIEEMGGSPEGE